MENIKIIVVDDHKMFVTALAAQLNEVEEIEVLDSMNNPKDLIPSIEKNNPDVVLMDIRMGKYNGLELAQELKARWKNLKIILMSGYNISYLAKDGSADAFTSKEESITSLAQTIKKVCIDQTNVFPIQECRILTEAEVKILNLISKDLTRKEIAAELFISEKTVTNHISSILEKLQVRSRVGAIMKGVEIGLIQGK